MKESTIVINAQITVIKKHGNGYSFNLDKRAIADVMKEALNCDDVLITSAKVFESEDEQYVRDY